MAHISKKLILSLTALAMPLTGITAAQAADATYTYSQFIETPGYKALQAAGENSYAKLATATGINIDMEVSGTSVGQQVTAITANVKATRTATVSTSTIEGVSSSVAYFDGSYYLSVNEATQELSLANGKTLAKRMPNSSTKLVKLGASLSPDSTLQDLNPSAVFTGQYNDQLISSFLNLGDGEFSFGDVTSSPNALIPTSTDYKYQMKMTEPNSGISVDLTTTETFNAEGLLTETSLKENMLFLGMAIVLDVKLTQTVDNTIVLTAPAADTFMTSAKFITLDNQISAEASQKPKANKILAKAKALAKSAKKPLAGSHLVAATKALKITAKSVKNGIKLTGKHKGVTGSLCVTAVKGVASTKNC